MDVGQQRIEIPLTVDDLDLEPSLPEGTPCPLTGVDTSRHPLLQASHRAVERDLTAANRQMVVVCKQAPRQDRHVVPLRDLFEDPRELRGLILRSEHSLPSTKPVVHMVETALHEHPRRPRQRVILMSRESHKTVIA